MSQLMNRLCKCTVAVATAALVVAPAASADDWVAKWSNGHKIENKDKGHKLKFGGRIMSDWHISDEDASLGGPDTDGTEFRRARLFFSGTVYDRIEFKAQYDFVGGAEFRDMWIAVKQKWDGGKGKFKIGHFKEYYSLEEQTSSKYITFLERSMPVNAFAPGRNSGIGFEGQSGDNFNYGFGYFYDSDDFGESVDEDRTNLTGRVVWRPVFDDGNIFHIGVGAHLRDYGDGTARFRVRPEQHLTDRFVDTGSFSADEATFLNLELAGVFGSFWAAGEYHTVDVDAPLFGDPTFDGLYLQAGYFLTGESRAYKTSSGAFNRIKPDSNFGDGGGAWEIAFRFSTIDLSDEAISGGEEDNLSLALNWYLNPVTRLMLNYVTAEVDNDAAGEPEGDADYIMLRAQIDF
ncbi:MAG: porin [Acidobacteriota bacterium]